ncbi:hypothetical protein F511_17286 [Dorcoceras hygrometricum]|uniref:Uncharacterized protein n=1 Tax=Dorcoceras hygrometricum TaxID=472368 RepID=A0A2Z7AAS2_9LAMI|nr:hypothetical protein F511_17286 [Dorcoceras hygrometricum]
MSVPCLRRAHFSSHYQRPQKRYGKNNLEERNSMLPALLQAETSTTGNCRPYGLVKIKGFATGTAYKDYACYSDHAQQDYLSGQLTPSLPSSRSPNSLHSHISSYTHLNSRQTSLAYIGRYYQLTPKLITLNDAAQHSRSEHSTPGTQNIPKLNPAKTPVRINYAAQRLPELLTRKLFSLETARNWFHNYELLSSKLKTANITGLHRMLLTAYA